MTTKRMKTEVLISKWAERPDEIMMEFLLRLPVKSTLLVSAPCAMLGSDPFPHGEGRGRRCFGSGQSRGYPLVRTCSTSALALAG